MVPYRNARREWRFVGQVARCCGCRCGDSGWILEAICRLDAVEAVEHGFNRDKSAMYAIERSVWRFVESGGIVVGPGRALGYARVFNVRVGGWMNIRTSRGRMVDLALLMQKYNGILCSALPQQSHSFRAKEVRYSTTHVFSWNRGLIWPSCPPTTPYNNNDTVVISTLSCTAYGVRYRRNVNVDASFLDSSLRCCFGGYTDTGLFINN